MIQNINTLKQKFETGKRPTQHDFHDLIDTIEVGGGGLKFINPATVLPAPTINTRYQATTAGTYENLKLADGSAAPEIAVTSADLLAYNVYLDYSATANTWTKNLNNIGGPQGPVGPQGPAGTVTADGVNGDFSVQGNIIAARATVGGILEIMSGVFSIGSGIREIFRVSGYMLCSAGTFTITATRNSFVHVSMWSWSASHPGVGFLTQLSSNDYSTVSLFLDISSNGDVVISADWGDAQTYALSVQKMSGGNIITANNNSVMTNPPTGYVRQDPVMSLRKGFIAYTARIENKAMIIGDTNALKIQKKTAGIGSLFMEFTDIADVRKGYMGYGSSSEDTFFVTNNIGDIILHSVTGGIKIMAKELAVNPTTSDIPAKFVMAVKNTTNGEARLWINDAGTMKSILFT